MYARRLSVYKYENLLTEISNKLGIFRGENEDENSFKFRIVYSIAGVQGLASLSDREDRDYISINHFKKRITDIFKAYLKLYPEVSRYLEKGKYKIDDNDIINDIYKIYLSSGNFYHANNKLYEPLSKEVKYKNIKFKRKYSIYEKNLLSGLGLYEINYDEIPEDYSKMTDLLSFFCIENITLNKYYLEYVDSREYVYKDRSDELMFLFHSDFYSGYWRSKPIETNGVKSLVKIKSEVYKLYMYNEKNIMFCDLKEWESEGDHFIKLSNAILHKNNALPKISYSFDGSIVYVKLGYILPPEEMNLFRLYSWPDKYSDFAMSMNRIMQSDVFNVFKEILTYRGYEFERR